MRAENTARFLEVTFALILDNENLVDPLYSLLLFISCVVS